MHTICTQNAHTQTNIYMHRTQDTTIMQHIQDNTEHTEQHTEHNINNPAYTTSTQNNTLVRTVMNI